MTNQVQHPNWTFLSNHTHVLHCIFLCPDIRIRYIADKVLIAERAVQRIVVDLERGGYLKRERVGRQNHYRLTPGLHLRHPLEHHVQVGRLLTVLQPGFAPATLQIPREPAVSAAHRPKAAPSRVGSLKLSRSKTKAAKTAKRVVKRPI